MTARTRLLRLLRLEKPLPSDRVVVVSTKLEAQSLREDRPRVGICIVTGVPRHPSWPAWQKG